MSLTLKSHAKINFFLQILGKREDGFHAIRTLMLPISLSDTLSFKPLDTPRIELECSDSSLPTDQRNLIRRAAELLQSRHAPDKGAYIHVQKRIPVGAGLGGGSSNGSTTLIGLNRLWQLNLSDRTLESLSSQFGSDTAFFITSHPALCEGRGEKLTPVPFPVSLPIFLLNFGFGSSTAWAYKNLELRMKNEELKNAEQNLKKLYKAIKSNSSLSVLNSQLALHNDLEKPVFRKFPILQLAKNFLLAQPSVTGAMMCGSGSTMMAILRKKEDGNVLKRAVQKHFGNSVWTWTGSTFPCSNYKQAE